MRLAVPLLAMMVGIAPVARAAAPDLAAIRALQAQSQWAASESLATAALADLAKQPKTDSLAIAEASYLAGVAHMRQTGYADGVALNDGLRARDIRARKLGNNTPPVAEAELLIGRALQGADHTDSALVHLKRAVDIYSATLAPKDTLVAEAWNQLALCHRDRREIREALDAWNQAIAARTLADGADSPAVALLQAQTGACWMELADFGRAREVLEGSLATFAKIGANDHPSRWVPLNILADLEARQGNYARDVDLLQESYRIVRLNFGDDSRQALTLRGNLATAFALMRDYGGAIALLQPLIPAYAAQYGATSSRTLNLQFLLAGAQAQITPGDAGLRRYTEIESLLAANPGPVRALLGTAYQQHAEQLQRRRRFSEALAMCDSAERSENARRTPSAQILAQTEYERVYSYVGLGDTAGLTRSRARLDQLRARYGSNLPVLPGTFQYFCAYADWKRGQADTAWSEALDCDQRNRESLRINLGRLSDRRSLQFAQGTVGEQDLVLSLAGSNPARLETAWDHMVRRRGLMRGELARRATPRGFEGDTAVAGANARWRSAQDRYARLLVRGVAGDSAARASIARAQLEANEAEQAYGDVLSARGAGAVPRDHGLADVRATLRAGQALLSIAINNGWRDSAHVSAFVARAGDPQLHRVELGLYGPLHAAVEAWTAALSTQPPADAKAAARAEADCRKLGAAVSARVWAPLAPLLAQSSEIFIVPDGPVVDLPWPALPVGSKKYFADQGPLMHPLDAEVAMLDSSAANGSGELLAVGAPDFNRTEAPSAPAGPMLAAVVRSAPDPCAAGAPLALPPLPGSGAEVTDILGEWNESRAGATHLLTGASATEQAFKAAAHGCEVIHIATHGVMRGDRCAEG
ncbi:MAG TPA: CHAT domain-containing protein, partial [Candidatus Sulfotelmatobacter sp.]|nr:CHAT domain-containing protein [Candidatus Sulfotelmatobacter sp.]